MTDNQINAADPHPRRRIAVLDTEISYVDTGQGDPIVFLHGNPTSSYLWRNIIPYVSDYGRCLAPDLVGMGKSGKSPARSYRLVDHIRYLDAWFEAMKLTSNVTLVIHDWGSALGFHRARRFPDQIKAIAYMEAIVRSASWADLPGFEAILRGIRSEAGEEMILDKNLFVEAILPGGILRELSGDEMDAYRRPFTDRDSRLPTLTWPRQIPIEGEPADVAEIVAAYGKWMAENALPKLLVAAEPGVIINGRTLEFCRTWKNQREITVKGSHFVQEDSPHEIGRALQNFVKSLGSAPPK